MDEARLEKSPERDRINQVLREVGGVLSAEVSQQFLAVEMKEDVPPCVKNDLHFEEESSVRLDWKILVEIRRLQHFTFEASSKILFLPA